MKRILLFSLLAATAAAHSQVISNGSFENAKVENGYWTGGLNADGWTFNANSGIAMGDSAWGRSAHSGAKYAYVQSRGDGIGMFCQVVQGFTIGQKYRVSFWMARRNTAVELIRAANVAVPVELLADNKVIFPMTKPKGTGEWQLYESKPFVATTKGITFTFMAETSDTDKTTLIDDVVLTPITRR
jgi:hypothetical protein